MAIYNGRRKVCVIFKTDTDNLNIVVYRYPNNLYIKEDEIVLNLTEYQLLMAKRVYLLSYIGIFTSCALYWMEALFIKRTTFVKDRCSLSNELFTDCTRDIKCHLAQ